MTEYDKILIASLDSFLNSKKVFISFETDTAVQLIKRAKEQKTLPIVFLENRAEFERVLPEAEFLAVKKEVMFAVSSQLQRSAELVRICSMMEKNGISYIVFKGAVCRALYTNPEYRTSTDEDLLVKAENIEKAKQILLANGYRLINEKSGEIKLANKFLNSLVELHSSLVDESVSDGMRAVGDIFKNQLEKSVSIDIGAGKVKTFTPTFGFLSLCVHFFNHFVRGGIGIRPVMDIACFISTYRAEIDFDFCFSVLETINAKKTIRTVMAICEKYFNVELNVSENDKTVNLLLSDILGAGAYGTADSGRVHSGAVTKNLAHKDKGIISTAFSVLIPSEDEIVSKHPEMRGKKREIRNYRIKRIIGFAGEKGKFKTVKTAGNRKKLLKELEIYE